MSKYVIRYEPQFDPAGFCTHFERQTWELKRTDLGFLYYTVIEQVDDTAERERNDREFREQVIRECLWGIENYPDE